jgi:hypothetical protein
MMIIIARNYSLPCNDSLMKVSMEANQDNAVTERYNQICATRSERNYLRTDPIQDGRRREKERGESEVLPRGGGVDCLHRNLASRKRLQKWKSDESETVKYGHESYGTKTRK